MSDVQDNAGKDMQTFISELMNTFTNSLGAMGKSKGDASQTDAPRSESKTEEKTTPEETLQTYLQSFQTINKVLSEPESIAGLLKGAEALPDLLSKIFQSSLESSFKLQNQFIEKAARIGSKTNAYQFEDLDQEMFLSWSEIYEKEFQQYFNIPQLGLNRFYIERLNQALDAYNIFQSRLSEFLFVLHLPMEKSMKVLAEQLSQKAENGELPDAPGDYYRLWIKILEGHYMTLLKSKEYTDTLNRTVQTLADFKSRRDGVIRDILKDFAIPTQSELDELYKDLYLVKKRLRALEKKQKTNNPD
jgi:polyhydroxyalkanoate synthase subunit PhaE